MFVISSDYPRVHWHGKYIDAEKLDKNKSLYWINWIILYFVVTGQDQFVAMEEAIFTTKW